MKLECDVIRDLLPLYAEKLASPASSALVEQHLAECEACRAELEQMEKPVPVQPEPQPDAPLRNIRKTLQKKSIRIAAAAVLAVLCAFGLAFWMGGAKTPVTAEQAKIWTYNKKENEANLCVLEVQGENVWLELEGSFNWGKPSVTVRAVRYTFPHIHAALEGLLGTEAPEEGLVERIALRETIDRLPEKERLTILLRYFKGLTQERTARVLGVSQVQVSRLERRGLERLRKSFVP